MQFSLEGALTSAYSFTLGMSDFTRFFSAVESQGRVWELEGEETHWKGGCEDGAREEISLRHSFSRVSA